MNLRPLAKLLVKKPRTVLLIFTLITLVIGFQVQNVYMESNLTGFLDPDAPVIELYGKVITEFSLGDTIIVYIEVDDLRDPDVLKEMDRVCTLIDEHTLDDGEIDGVISVRSISNLIKEENSKSPIIGGLGGTGNKAIPNDINLIYSYIARNPIQIMEGTLFTNTYDVAVIIIQLAENADYDEILQKTQYAIDHRGTTYSDMTVTGTVALQKEIQKTSMDQLVFIFPIAILLVSLVLLFFHRSFKGIIIAFLPPAFALILTFGTLGIVYPELTLISVSVVALLMGLGVDYSIHLMNRFTEEHTIEDKIDRMEKTLGSTGKAVLLSTITTMIGFGSLMISSMTPMVAFGFACSIGILYCFISAVILVPCLVLILKFEKNGHISNWKKFANFTINNRKRIIVIALFFAVMSLILIPQIKTDVNYYDMAPEGISSLEALNKYSNTFGGGSNFNALYIETDVDGLTYPEVIESIFAMEEEIRGAIADTFPEIDETKIESSVTSIADELKKVNDILKKNDIVEKLADYVDVDKILFDRIAEEGLIDEDFSKTIVIVSIPAGKGVSEIEILINKINLIADQTIIPHGGRVVSYNPNDKDPVYITGQDAINVAINKKLADEQTRSMIIALLLVLASLIIIFNSSLYGFLTMIPVAFVLIWEPGFLVALDIPLSVVTISIASIMIGIGIDYGVHITQRVREEMAKGLSNKQATKVAIEKTGLSLLEAALTTVAGLLSIYFVQIPALQEFGLVILLMVTLSCIAAALILPTFYISKLVK